MKKFFKILTIITIILIPTLGLAQTTNNTEVTVSIENPTNAGDDLMSILIAILNNVIMPIAAVAVVMWIIYAGFTFLTAQGKPAEIEKAKQRLLWSLVGAGILLGAVGISAVVKNTINSLLN